MSALIRFKCVVIILGCFLWSCGGPRPPIGGSGGSGPRPDGGDAGSNLRPLSPPGQPCAFVETRRVRTGNSNCPNGVFAGDILVTTPADLQKLAGCTRVTGSISISTGVLALQNLAGLESLTAIEGNFVVYNGQFESLAELEHLRCVGGEFSASNINSTEPGRLAELEEIEGSLEASPTLTFPVLRRVWGNLSAQPASVPALTTVYGGAPASGFSHLEYVGCGSSFPPCRDGVLGCSVLSPASQSELDRLSACKVAVQTIKLEGDLELSPLRNLRWVRQALSIATSSARTLEPLEDLEHVGQLALTNNLALEDVSALNGLEFTSLVLDSNPKLASLESWTAMRWKPPSRGSSFYPSGITITNNSALTRLGNWRWLTKADQLTIANTPVQSLPALSALESLHTLSLSKLPALKNLRGLEAVQTLSTINLNECAALESLEGLDGASTVKDLNMADLPALRSVEGLSGLRSLSRLSLNYLPLLSSLSGMSSLTSLEFANVISCPALQNFAGLEGVSALTQLTVQRALALTSLKGLSGLRSVSSMVFEDVPVLSSLSGMSSLASVDHLGIHFARALPNLKGLERIKSLLSLGITHSAIESLAGLEGLEEVRSLTLTNNPRLQNLHGLQNVKGPGSLDIKANFQLSDCEVRWLTEKLGVSLSPDSRNGGPLYCNGAPAPIPGLTWSKFHDFPGGIPAELRPLRESGNGLAVVTVGFPWDPFDRKASGFTTTMLNGFSASGEARWATELSGPTSQTPNGLCWGVDDADTITVVTDELDWSQPSPAIYKTYTTIFRFRSDGTLLAKRRGDLIATAKSCAVDGNGNIYFASVLFATNTLSISKQDPNGNSIWQKTANLPPIPDFGFGVGFPTVQVSVNLTAPGLLIGVGPSEAARYQFLTRVLDDGSVTWTKSLQGGYLFPIKQAPDGSIVALGRGYQAFDFGSGPVPITIDRTLLARFANDGSVTWRIIDGASEGGQPVFALGADNSMYLFTGKPLRAYTFTTENGGTSQVTTSSLIKLDAAGRLVYSRDLSALVAAYWGSDELHATGLEMIGGRLTLAGWIPLHLFLAQFQP
jgi:hypothetical protein